MLLSETLRIANLVTCTEAEGPGRRFAIWLQGCPLRCPGCCNPEMLPFAGGQSVSTAQLFRDILAAQQRDAIEGVTLLGGEPFAQAPGAAELCRRLQQAGLTVMVFSGYAMTELSDRKDPAVASLLEVTDILVDGRYERDNPDTQRRWIGSTNQQIHFLSDRYRGDDTCWRQPDTLEIRLEGGELSINGFPAPNLRTLWQRIAR